MEIRRVRSGPKVAANQGRVSIQRGPIVYCLEGTDHADNARRVRNAVLPPNAPITAEPRDLLGGVMVLRSRGLAMTRGRDGPVTTPLELTAVPYCVWDNREPGEMIVWIPETEAAAELP
jgi:uncharacterized protein